VPYYRKSGYCKPCRKAYTEEKKANDPEAFRSAQAKRKHRYNRSAKGKLASKRNHEKFKEHELEYGRKYYWKHRDERIANALRWNKSNPEKVRLQTKAYRKRNAFSFRIRSSLRKHLLRKTDHTFVLLGYTSAALREHLSKWLGRPCEICSQVVLTIENCHIEHIKPLALARCDADVVQLNQLANLRLLCKECNKKKEDFIEQFDASSGSISYHRARKAPKR
jgi:5-methylcytosine-specific restriction endonuclease McrA